MEAGMSNGVITARQPTGADPVASAGQLPWIGT